MTQSFEQDAAAAVARPDTVPESMATEFSSLTTAYCWVITEDLVAGYDGAAPSAVGTYGPAGAGLGDLHEALCAGRWFRLTGDDGQGRAVGRIYDPSGDNKDAPLDEIGGPAWGASIIEYRQGGQWGDTEHSATEHSATEHSATEHSAIEHRDTEHKE
jgi:hypothetical protein